MRKLNCSKDHHNRMFKATSCHRTFLRDLVAPWEYYQDGDKIIMKRVPSHLMKLWCVVMYIPALVVYGIVNYKEVHEEIGDVWNRKPVRTDEASVKYFEDTYHE
jgi:hypothetical protein